MKIAFAKPEDRDEVLKWVRSQEGHEDWTFLNWSDVLVVRDDVGSICAISELASFQTADFVFDVAKNGRQTLETWNAICHYFDEKKISPLVIVSKKSPLFRYARRMLKRAFVGFEFFRR